ncbi:hypothetical protein HI914_04638 [Erysiphe necator]|nr:hypothetical protein HI914_04638 [Erysiphe necator]
MPNIVEKKSNSILGLYLIIGGQGGRTGLVFAVIGIFLLILSLFVLVVRLVAIFTNSAHLGNIGWGFRPDLCKDLHDLEMGWDMIETTELSEAEKVVQKVRKRRELTARVNLGHLESFSHSSSSPQLPAPSWSQSSSFTSGSVLITRKNQTSLERTAYGIDKTGVKGKHRGEMSDTAANSLDEDTHQRILESDKVNGN